MQRSKTFDTLVGEVLFDAGRTIASPSITGTATADELVVEGDSITIETAKTPASATAAGVAGEIAWDANYIYVCTAANTWKRVAIATWP